jgi:ABC-type sugar transport system ATPase subunit
VFNKLAAGVDPPAEINWFEGDVATPENEAEKIFKGRMLKNKIGLINRKKMFSECRKYLKNLGVDYIDPKILVKNLSVSQMQLVEITKAVHLI